MTRKLKTAFKDADMPNAGEFVNDFFARHGIRTIQMGKTRLRVETPRRKSATAPSRRKTNKTV